MSLKECSRCRQEKPVAEFRAAKKAADGLHPWCRPCDSAYAAKRRARQPRTPDARRAWLAPTCQPPTTPVEIGYFAGLLDGEGTIAADQMAVIMTCEDTILWLARFGGQVTKLPIRTGLHGQPKRQQWRWRLTGIANVRLMLTAMLPVLITKQARACDLLKQIAQMPGASMSYR